MTSPKVFLVGVLALTSCIHSIHPGAFNRVDSQAYDMLVVGQAVIDQARASYQAGELPTSVEPLISNMIYAYNVARESWLTYRGVLFTKGVPPDIYQDELTRNINNLLGAIQAYKAKVKSQ